MTSINELKEYLNLGLITPKELYCYCKELTSPVFNKALSNSGIKLYDEVNNFYSKKSNSSFSSFISGKLNNDLSKALREEGMDFLLPVFNKALNYYVNEVYIQELKKEFDEEIKDCKIFQEIYYFSLPNDFFKKIINSARLIIESNEDINKENFSIIKKNAFEQIKDDLGINNVKNFSEFLVNVWDSNSYSELLNYFLKKPYKNNELLN